MIELWKNRLLECHRCTLNIQRPFLEATNAKAEIEQSGRWFIALSTFTLRTTDVIKQIYDFREIWLRIWNQWKTFIYKKRKFDNRNIRQFQLSNWKSTAESLKKKKEKDLCAIQLKDKFSWKLLFLYLQTTL